MESVGVGRVLPGAVNAGGCTFSQGYYENRAFIVYASGPNVIVLTKQLEWVQTLSSVSFGFPSVRTNCVHCAELGGKIAAGWGNNVAIFQPVTNDGAGKLFPATWQLCDTLLLDGPVFSVCWKKSGNQLLVGGDSLTLWDSPKTRRESSLFSVNMKKIWSCRVASPIHYLKFSSDNHLFATAALNSRKVKVWFKQKNVESDDNDTSMDIQYGFIYLNHPNTVTGFMWRKLSPLMPVGHVSNVLLTYCVDNVCRLWKHHIKNRRRTRYSRLQFHIATTISPNSDIPFRSTMPVKDAPFTVHWLDNKEMAYTRRAEKVRKGYTGMLSHHPSISSLQSYQEANQDQADVGWDYVESGFARSGSLTEDFDSTGGESSKYYSSDWCYNSYTPLQNKPAVHIGQCSIPTKDFLKFLDDWCNSADLLLCVHPNSGSLMIWTVEGLDSSSTCHRLAHVNFSSCLPHIFPPSDAFTLCQELLTFRHKPVLDSVASHNISCDNFDEFLVVDDADNQETSASKPYSERIVDPASSLSVLSCHTNGSLNLWSVELGALPFTSVSGLIHIAHVSGHHSSITSVMKHPSLPIVISTSSVTEDRDGELIVWRSGQLGVYSDKSRLTELSRISSSHPNSFKRVAWFPLLCKITSKSHIPIGGIFVTVVGNSLCLFESNFYSSYSVNKKRHSSLHSFDTVGKTHPTISTSALDISTFVGSNPLCFIGCLEKELFSSIEGSIIFMHVYPAGSFPSLHLDNEDGEVFYVLVLENVIPDTKERESYHSYSHIQTLAHLWQVVMVENVVTVNSPASPLVTSYPPVGSWQKQQTSFLGTSVETVTINSQNFEVKSKKLSMEPLVLPHGVYIEQCQSICDVQSSDISTSFSSFIFASSCSDGVLRFWQYKCTEEDSKKSHSWSSSTHGMSSGIDFSTGDTVLSSYALSSLIPVSYTFANPSCVAVVFYLSKPPLDDSSSPPNAQYALLTIWECMSSASEKWTCQTRMLISCSAVSVEDARPSPVLLEWIPVGNSHNVLACCFGSRLSLYSTINDSKDPWVLLCCGNLMQSDLRLDATLLSYVGNSNLLTVADCEFTIITLKSLSSKNSHFTLSNVKDLILHSSMDTFSLLKEAYSNQSALPEYHPQVLTDLISAGRLDLVKTILLNVSLYVIDTVAMTSNENDLDSFEYDYDVDFDDSKAHQRMLSISSEGAIIKSKKAKLISIEGTIPPVNLSQCHFMAEPPNMDTAEAANDDDDLFMTSPIEDYVAFSDDQAEPVDMSQFSPQVAARLLKILQSYLLPGLTVLEQVCLAATIDTVANAKMSFSDQSGRPTHSRDDSGVTIALSSGVGYAVGGGIKGGGEAMDDCGLRYLLKLKNHILYQGSIPKDAKRDVLPPQDIIWAFHSDADSDLLSSIPCVQSDKCSWPELREAGVGWWLRSNDTLKRLIEKVAKAQFTEKQEPLDASLFYLAMKKQNVLKLLFRNVGDERMMNFFKNDFTQHRWYTAALKNAFALLTKQRFEHAAAFFLLANKLWDAVEVCVSRLHDLQLAFVIIRLYEGDGSPTYNRLLKENILGIPVESKVSLVADSNPFLRSIAYWLIQEYSESLETLLATPDSCTEDSNFATIFNFYIFLRSHPLLLRRKFAADGDKISTKRNKCISSVGSEKWTSFERRLLFNTAISYLQRGSPLVALDVLSKLPDESLLLGDDLMCNTIEHAEPTMTDMIQKGTISSPRPKESTSDDDIDWGQPVSTRLVEDDDFDWSQPVTSQLQDEDWSQPENDGLEHLLSEEPSPPVDVKIELTQSNVCTDMVTHFRQLKFDACLTILTAGLLSLQSSTIDNLRSALRDWLSKELQATRVICRRSTELDDNNFSREDHKMVSRLYWFICQQSSMPGILDCELLLLLQDTLRATTQDPSVEAWCKQEFPTCVMSPTNLPLLTCTMLPFAHPFSLAFHLKSLIQSIVECISNYSFPVSYMVNRQKPSALLQLCEALSNCVSLSIGCVPCDSKSRTKAENLLVQSDPSRWPGVTNWPNLLPSDEGRDPVRISVLLAECLVAVYLGLLADAWSEHKIGRLLYLTANCPSKEMWFRVFGGVLSFDPAKSSKKKSSTKGKSFKSQDVISKALAVFFPPWRTILNAFTSKPPDNTSINFKFPKEQKSIVRASNLELLADEDNPFSYVWSLMNTGITKIVKDAVKSSLAAAGMEIMELPVCSPLLHLAVKTLDSWEEGFQSQLDSFGGAPSEMVDATSHKGQGPALLQHKSILEPDSSPFRSSTDNGELASKMWEYLVKQEEIREMFIHNLFNDKSTNSIQDISGTILYKDVDGEVSTFCLNSANPTVIAAATSRQIIEMDVTDILMNTDSYTITEEYCDLPVAKQNLTPNYPSAVNNETEDFLVVHPARSPIHHNPFYSMGMDLQTGTSVNMLLRRDLAGVKELEAHPTLPYYLSGSQDGSIFMWEFANARPIVTHRSSGSSITKIRFTQQGNKFGVGDVTGRLHLWQGLHSNEKGPYQTLNCHSRTIHDFAFLSSSSFIATAGDSADNNNVCLWDTLLPDKRALVHKYACLESGASAIAHSPSTQLLVAGGKHGHLSVFDIRHHVLLRNINAHTSAISCIALNNIENYFVTASAEGEVKIWDLVKLTEISSFSGEHNRSRLFRSEGGVMQLFLTNDSTLYSSGADGSLKCRTLVVDT